MTSKHGNSNLLNILVLVYCKPFFIRDYFHSCFFYDQLVHSVHFSRSSLLIHMELNVIFGLWREIFATMMLSWTLRNILECKLKSVHSILYMYNFSVGLRWLKNITSFFLKKKHHFHCLNLCSWESIWKKRKVRCEGSYVPSDALFMYFCQIKC
jgi:hypothetical protein